MKKLALSIVLSGYLFAQVPLVLNEKIVVVKHPMDIRFLSQESGALLTAEESYSDGIGVMLVEASGESRIDNSPLNTLVKKYGSAAASAGITLKEYSLTTGNNKDKELSNKLMDYKPFIEISSIEEAYLSNSIKLNGKSILNGDELVFDGTYWKDKNDNIKRYCL